MMDLHALRHAFGRDDAVTFDDLGEGHVLCRLRGTAGSGSFLITGAQLWSWAPAGQVDLLWHSEAMPPRRGVPPYGGIPICWPWLGAPPVEGLPYHGHVRMHPWTLRSIEATRAGGFTVRLTTDEGDAPAVGQPFTLEAVFELGAGLRMTLHVRNSGEGDLVSRGALHTYLRIGDRRRIALDGLVGLPWQRGLNDPILIDRGEALPDEEWIRNYHDAAAMVRVRCGALDRTLIVSHEDSGTLTLWNPGPAKAATMPGIGDDEWPEFLCLEPGTILHDARTLPPGGHHALVTRIAVE